MPYNPELLEQIANAQDRFVWEATSWEKVERGPRWFWGMCIIALMFTLYAIFTANYLFAFIVLIAAVILIISDKQEPHQILIQIGENGVVYDGTFYPFEELSDFAVIYEPPETKILYLEPKQVWKPRLRIFLEDQDPVELRRHVKKHLDEDLTLHEEHFSDIIGRLLKL